MDEMVVISVKIPKSLKDKIKRSKRSLSETVRSMLEHEALYEEALQLNRDVKKNREIFDKIAVEDVVSSIRHDRDAR